MDENRRSFLKKAGSAALGLGCGFPLLSAGCNALKHEAEDGAPSEDQWAMIVDIEKCLNEDIRKACIQACKERHDLPDNPESGEDRRKIQWIWEER
ncbi:MAG: twin-arginine translocation signal domain-containing protein, partial [Planctomycetota bacterium]